MTFKTLISRSPRDLPHDSKAHSSRISLCLSQDAQNTIIKIIYNNEIVASKRILIFHTAHFPPRIKKSLPDFSFGSF